MPTVSQVPRRSAIPEAIVKVQPMTGNGSVSISDSQRAFDAGDRAAAKQDLAPLHFHGHASVPAQLHALAGRIAAPDLVDSARHLQVRRHADVAAAAYGIFRNAVRGRERTNVNC